MSRVSKARHALPCWSCFLMVIPALPLASPPPSRGGPCDAPANEIVAENCLPGNPPRSGTSAARAIRPSRASRPTSASTRARRSTSRSTRTSTDYRLDIYRLGYYGGAARAWSTRSQPSRHAAADAAGLPRDRRHDRTTTSSTAATGPCRRRGPCRPTPSSGIYIARATREDAAATPATSSSSSATTTAAPTSCSRPPTRPGRPTTSTAATASTAARGHAHKVSYNRPFTTRGDADRGLAVQRRVPDAPLARAQRLRRQLLHRRRLGPQRRARSSSTRRSCRSATTSTGRPGSAPTSRRPATPAWTSPSSAATRSTGRPAGSRAPPTAAAPTTARSSPTRRATPRAASTGTARQLRLRPDPTPGPASGGRTQPGHDGGRPENALTGQISWGDATTAIQVPAADTAPALLAQHRDDAAPTTLTGDTLGYEFDWEQPAYAGCNPAGRITLSDTTAGGKNHQMSLYRAPSGALVFGAGTVQWSWGLDGTHDRGGSHRDPRMQQATVNLLPTWAPSPRRCRPAWSPGGRSTRPRRPRRSPIPPTARPSPAAPSRSPARPPTPAASSAASRSRPTAGRPGTARRARRAGRTPSTRPTGPVTVQARAVDDAANIGTAGAA